MVSPLAAVKACRQIHKLKDKASLLPESAAEDVGFLLDAHLAMLSNSRLTRGVEKRIVTDRGADTAAQIEALRDRERLDTEDEVK